MLPLDTVLGRDDGKYHDYSQIVARVLAKRIGASQVQVARQLSLLCQKIIVIFLLFPMCLCLFFLLTTTDMTYKAPADYKDRT
jgi:hypothetical protein